MKISGIMAIFCGLIPLIIMIGIFGGAAFLLFFDEASPLFVTIFYLYDNLYPFVLVGGMLLMILFLFFIFRVLAQYKQTRTVVINLTLVFLVINMLICLASYLISGFRSSILLLVYWPPFGMMMEWNEIMINPLFMGWAIFVTVITLGTILLFGYSLLILNKYLSNVNLKLLAIFFLVQCAIYTSQIIFSLNLTPRVQQQIVFWIFLCGFLISLLFVLAGFSLHRKTGLKLEIK